METERALEIIINLADGVDPITGEIFPQSSPYQKPEIIRALFMAYVALQKAAKNKSKKANLPERNGEKWEESEEKELCDEFDSGTDLREIAEKHNRTLGAIRSRLIRKGKIDGDVFHRRSGS